MTTIDCAAVTTLRLLAVDAVEKANSGHPGFPLGAAPLMYTVWDRFMKYNPQDPTWFNRDRFVLSAGHGSALLYAMLHLAGFDLSLEDLRNFRQWGSRTPGHPEYGMTAGVDASTGPLGHGVAMAVGFAVGEAMLAGQYNRDGFPVVDHYTYGIVSDGDMMEGVASEASSLAGTLALGKLILLYDDNRITIEGKTDLAFREDVGGRFAAYGWQVLRVDDAENIAALQRAVEAGRAETDRPTLIVVRTHIGCGSPKQDSSSVHGEPLGAEALKKTKENFGWPAEAAFYVPDEVKAYFAAKLNVCQKAESDWRELWQSYEKAYPALAVELQARRDGIIEIDTAKLLSAFAETGKTSTREASGELIQYLAAALPALTGGSADLGPSNKTEIKGVGSFSAETRNGRNLHFGVREHAMGKIVNGLALHGCFIPYGATFLVFSDFMRPAVRMAALMKIGSIFIFTHDSVALGEDGPTHQPIEQTMSLRLIPGLTVIRPADALETALAWQIAVQSSKRPTALLLTRQKLPVLHAFREQITEGVPKGGYILSDVNDPAAVIIATGSEVHLALAAQKQLAEESIRVRVVSLPSWELFEEQTAAYKETVLPEKLPKIAVEAGVTLGWARYTGTEDRVLGINKFGASAPGDVVYREYGFTVDKVAQKVKALF